MSQITDGTAQDNRFPPALRDHYFNVDERSFEDVISRTAEFVKHVHYYNLSNSKDETWKDLFAADNAVIMTDILATDSRRMESEFLGHLEKDRPGLPAASYLVGFAHRINSWYTHLLGSEDESGRVLTKHIEALVEKKLSEPLEEVENILRSQPESKVASRDVELLSHFHEIWKYHRGKGHPRHDDATVLRSTFYSLVSAVSNLKPIAAEQLGRSLKSGNHEPAVALFLAFARLFGKAQDRVNLFTARHRDFYYGDVLRMKPRGQVLDSTFLVLSAAQSGTSLLVPAGTEFTAGKQGGDSEVIYRSDSGLNVTDAQVRDLRTLYCSRDPQISPEIDLHYICALRTAKILPATTSAISDTGAVSWPIFGADKPETEVSTGEDATIGFAVASSALLLREGDREIVVIISFRIPASLDNVPAGAEAVANSLGAGVRHLILEQRSFAQERGAALEEVFEELGHGLLTQEQRTDLEELIGQLGHNLLMPEQRTDLDKQVEKLGHDFLAPEQITNLHRLVEQLGHDLLTPEQRTYLKKLVEQLGHNLPTQEQRSDLEKLIEKLGQGLLSAEQRADLDKQIEQLGLDFFTPEQITDLHKLVEQLGHDLLTQEQIVYLHELVEDLSRNLLTPEQRAALGKLFEPLREERTDLNKLTGQLSHAMLTRRQRTDLHKLVEQLGHKLLTQEQKANLDKLVGTLGHDLLTHEQIAYLEKLVETRGRHLLTHQQRVALGKLFEQMREQRTGLSKLKNLGHHLLTPEQRAELDKLVEQLGHPLLTQEQITDLERLVEKLGLNLLTREQRAALGRLFEQLRRSVALDSFDRKDLLRQEPPYIFHRVIGDAFNVGITVASGWHEVHNYVVSMPKGTESGLYQLTFTLTFGPDVPAIAACNPDIHGAGFETKLPVLRFRVNPRANVYPYSLLRDLQIDEIVVGSHVADAIRNVAWNQHGQLDTSKPFNPFGPLPTANSYLIVGNYESARANLTQLIVNLEWGDLPETVGGFKEYYRGYSTTFANDTFLAGLSVLRDGRWRPSLEEGRPTAVLFDTEPEGGKVGQQRSITIDVLRYFKRLDPAVTEEQFRYDLRARDGFFRIALAGPEAGFGHLEYPSYLTRVLSENALRSKRFRREPQPLPNPPYTPVVNRMSLTYAARSAIRVGCGTPDASNPFEEKVYHIRPFGIATVDTNRAWTMLPVYEEDGSLLIGFSATDPSGVLTLLFHLREDSVTDISFTPEPVFWYYLASDQWQPLSEFQLLSDTTDGFLSSGIVTLQVPDDINQNNTVMPPDLYWLRVSARKNLESFCSLYSVQAQAVSVTREGTEDVSAAPSALVKALPAGSIPGPVRSIAGLRSVTQPLPSTGGRKAETSEQMITRTSERLRHKCRASTPWDYERLVLENFPEVFKVKCFSAMSSHSGIRPAPGSVLVVVVPQQTEHDSGKVFDPMLDANQLKRIREFLKVASAQARIEVRNPVYERVLIRCSVKFRGEAMRQTGRYLSLLNQALIDYISPWSGVGAPFRFGWSFKREEVEAYLLKLPYLEFVTKFSMLHITRKEKGSYGMEDTARHLSAKESSRILPRFPWSLATPNQTHILETTDDSRRVKAEVTGIGDLAIGNTLIVGR
jgi:hypothetical protein